MNKLLLGLATVVFLAATVGCANGPFSRWMCGSECDTCKPPTGQPFGNFSGDCASGTCSAGPTGTGFAGNMYGAPNGMATAPPASIPAASFQNTTAGYGSSGSDFYGNSGSAGQLELPPAGPYN